MRSLTIAVTAISFFMAVTPATPAATTDLSVVASTAMTEILQAVVPNFEHDTGQKVKIVFMNAAELPVKVEQGIPVDLVITSPDIVDDLVKSGKIVPGTSVDFMRSRVGVAVRAGAPKPDISTVDGFKKALLAAKSVGISEGPSGVYLLELMKKLGIADQVKAKAVFTKPGHRVGPLMASGEVEIGVQQITELLATPGIDYIGPLPQSIQTSIVYVMARSTSTKDPEAVKKLVTFLSSKSVAPVAKKMGLDPAAK
jgi:molybdate transport system substrate-binding protein